MATLYYARVGCRRCLLRSWQIEHGRTSNCRLVLAGSLFSNAQSLRAEGTSVQSGTSRQLFFSRRSLPGRRSLFQIDEVILMMRRTVETRVLGLACRLVCAAILCLQMTAAVFSAPFQVEETFDVDPLWDGLDNKAAPNDFGFSNSNFTGAASGAGEAGGVLSRDPVSWYAADVGELDPSTNALSVTGTGYLDLDSNNDGQSFFGWFDADTPHTDQYPKDFIGFRLVNDPPYQIRMLYATGGIVGQQVVAQFGDSTGFDEEVPFTFDMNYDPSANFGDGRMTLSINASSDIPLNFGAGHKDAFSTLDHFGMISPNIPGSAKSSTVFYDDLNYTANTIPEPGSATFLALGGIALGMLCRRRK